jgi:hypothetical protein
MLGSRFKRALLAATASAALLSAAEAHASIITLTFEGLQNKEDILNFYAGGKGSLLSGPGPSDGITFSNNALTLISHAAGGTGNFSNAPSGVTANYFLTGTSETMNSTGFTSLSFDYSSDSVNVGGVIPVATVYSGMNGTGSVLASLTLPDTGNNGPTNGFFNKWILENMTFSGTAESVVFAGHNNDIGFDNITVSAVPAPAIGQSLASVLAVGGIFFGAKLSERGKGRRSPRSAIP